MEKINKCVELCAVLRAVVPCYVEESRKVLQQLYLGFAFNYTRPL